MQAVVALARVALFGLAGIVVVILRVVAQQQIINAQQKRAAAARDVGKAHFGNLCGRLAFNQFADGVFDNVADDVFRRVINAAGLADFRLFLDSGALVRRHDHLAEKPFVNAAENVNRDGVEIVRRIDMAKGFANSGKLVVVHFEGWRVENGVFS